MTDQEWFELAQEQLEALESTARAELAAFEAPPTGDQATRRREVRRRARIEKLDEYLHHYVDQVTRAREALADEPRAGRAVYHSLMAGVFSQFSHTVDVREDRRGKRESAIETNYKKNYRKKNPA